LTARMPAFAASSRSRTFRPPNVVSAVDKLYSIFRRSSATIAAVSGR
jgi:hypothetical protein